MPFVREAATNGIGSPRPQRLLVERLPHFEDQALTIVSGPAGSGKTTLLRHWYTQRHTASKSSAWLTLRPGGAAPDSSLGQIRHGLRSLMSAPPPAMTDPGADIHNLNELLPGTSRVLFLDDIGASHQATIEDLVELFLGLPGPPWQVVGAGRRPFRRPLTLPPGAVRILGPADLRLDDDAVAEVLLSHRPELQAEHLWTVVTMVDGWAAGAHLAGQAIAAAPDPDETIRHFDGRDLAVSDYLETEVFGGLRPSDQDFLILSSVLRQPTTGGCRAVTGDHFSSARLTALGQQSALILGEPDGEGHRWMPMAREFLLAKLSVRPVDEIIATRTRYRDWAVSTLRYGEAVEQAAAIDDWGAVVDIVLAAGLDTLASGQAVDVVRRLRTTPPHLLQEEAGVAVVAAATTWAEADGVGVTVDDWLDHAAVSGRGRPPGTATSLAAAIDIARASFSSLGAGERQALAQRAISDAPSETTAWAVLARAALGIAAHLDDDPIVARHALTECLRLQASLTDDREQTFSRLAATSALGALALLEIGDGEFGRADAILSAASLIPVGTDASPIGAGTVALARAVRADHRGFDRSAADELTKVGQRSLVPEIRVLAHLEAAAAFDRLGLDDDRARALADADELLDAMPRPGRRPVRRRQDLERRAEAHQIEGLTADQTLTERELEVLRLLATELTRREIAGDLFLAHNTVKTYIQRLYQKLGVSSRPAAVAQARELGWLE